LAVRYGSSRTAARSWLATAERWALIALALDAGPQSRGCQVRGPLHFVTTPTLGEKVMTKQINVGLSVGQTAIRCFV
jgi:hypothetical protein